MVWKSKLRTSGKVFIQVDGKNPSAFKGCYYYTRPALDTASYFLNRIGLLIGMELTDKARPEDWMLSIIWVDTIQQKIRFSLSGSVTGEDGVGSSDSLFRSTSDKIIIQPGFWFRAKEFAKFPWLKPGDVLHWQVRSMCHDEIKPQPSATITIIQGLENGPHQLQLQGKALKDLQALIVYEPPLK